MCKSNSHRTFLHKYSTRKYDHLPNVNIQSGEIVLPNVNIQSGETIEPQKVIYISNAVHSFFSYGNSNNKSVLINTAIIHFTDVNSIKRPFTRFSFSD